MTIAVEDLNGVPVLAVLGRWTAAEAAQCFDWVETTSIPAGGLTLVARIDALDLTGAYLLRRLERRAEEAGLSVRWSSPRPELLGFTDTLNAEVCAAQPLPADAMPVGALLPLDRLGRWAVHGGDAARGVIDFLGRIYAVAGGAIGHPKRLRPRSILRQVYETGLQAVPIVALIAFLISVIVAYIGAQQLRQFGAQPFVVDLVTIAVLRELGVLLTAIIVAGRSGSAFAAEIGAMKLNEEVDALRAIGLNPIELLVLPRVLGLIIALPLLTIVADAMGLAGGAMLSWLIVDIPFNQFLVRMQEAMAPTTFWAGLIKAPVFAFLIALIGTFRGLQVRETSRELGRLTTVAVVQSIFLVLLADALFAVIFWEIDF
ncbi:MAG: ABC transporter permease [Pseudomonadota bacterium]|jgi:phospholipid/cholesterol/gamma-HCH transport system permease protein